MGESDPNFNDPDVDIPRSTLGDKKTSFLGSLFGSRRKNICGKAKVGRDWEKYYN